MDEWEENTQTRHGIITAKFLSWEYPCLFLGTEMHPKNSENTEELRCGVGDTERWERQTKAMAKPHMSPKLSYVMSFKEAISGLKVRVTYTELASSTDYCHMYFFSRGFIYLVTI